MGLSDRFAASADMGEAMKTRQLAKIGSLLAALVSGVPAHAADEDVTVGILSRQHRMALVRQLHRALQHARRREGLGDGRFECKRGRADAAQSDL